MKTTLTITAALIGTAFAAQAQEKQVNVLSWGGAYSRAQVEAYNKPFEAETGIKVVMVDADNPATPVKAQAEAGNVTTDLASVGYADAMRLCDEGAVMAIDPAKLAPAADGTAAADDFLEGGLAECFVATDVYATITAYDESRFPDKKPETLADFFDLETFPGKRGMLKKARFNLEMALMADGVPASEVYEVLATPEGADRAFAKLDTIKSEIVWWEAGAQPPQLLADGEVVMTQAYNGRIFTAAVDEGRPFRIIWDGQIYEMEGWVIPEGAPHPDEAMEYLRFSTSAQSLANAAMQISYGPPRKSSAPLVGTYTDGKTEMAPHLPTSPENMGNALAFNNEYWVDHDGQMNERFNAWLAAN